MASTTQDEVYRAFLAASGQQTAALGEANAVLADAIAQLLELPSVTATAGANPPNALLADVIAQIGEVRKSVATPAAVATKTQATTQAASKESGGTVGAVASAVLKTGFGLAPLISGLLGLFGGGEADPPAPLVKYALPAAIDFQAAESQGRVTGLDYDQMGMPRRYGEGQGRASSSVTVNGAAPQITVNVQAMDARSFLDRSSDIALAVRDAMLNLNAINDVVNEL